VHVPCKSNFPPAVRRHPVSREIKRQAPAQPPHHHSSKLQRALGSRKLMTWLATLGGRVHTPAVCNYLYHSTLERAARGWRGSCLISLQSCPAIIIQLPVTRSALQPACKLHFWYLERANTWVGRPPAEHTCNAGCILEQTPGNCF
jgi:hypothetical protein